MKKLKLIGCSILLTAGSFMVGCGNETAHGPGKAYTSAYVCPMHCEGSGGEEAGKCPVCGMDYVKLEEHTKVEHSH